MYAHLLEHKSHILNTNREEVWQVAGCPKYSTGDRQMVGKHTIIGTHMLEDYGYYGLEHKYTKKACH
jgi:hypothetical protein